MLVSDVIDHRTVMLLIAAPAFSELKIKHAIRTVGNRLQTAESMHSRAA